MVLAEIPTRHRRKALFKKIAREAAERLSLAGEIGLENLVAT